MHGPSPERKGRPQARRWPLAAAVLAAVALVHGLALVSLATAGSAVDPAHMPATCMREGGKSHR